MPHRQIHAPLTVISPHLDDAVFSCGCLIAAAQDPVVVTVLAGVPRERTVSTDWDLAAGFDTATQAVIHRRQEDARSLKRLGARPEWLDFLDGQYGLRYGPEQLATSLAAAVALHRGGTVVVPMGLFHSDHILVSRACLLMMRATTMAMPPVTTAPLRPASPLPALPPLRWLFYEDVIHRRVPGVVQDRLRHWWQEGLVTTPVDFALTPYQAIKMEAAEAYASQLPLFDAHQLADLAAPERYWSIDIASVETAAPDRTSIVASQREVQALQRASRA